MRGVAAWGLQRKNQSTRRAGQKVFGFRDCALTKNNLTLFRQRAITAFGGEGDVPVRV
jgi:hypothetical protein